MKVTDKLLSLLDDVAAASSESRQCREVALRADAQAMAAHSNFGNAKQREDKAVELLLEYLRDPSQGLNSSSAFFGFGRNKGEVE